MLNKIFLPVVIFIKHGIAKLLLTIQLYPLSIFLFKLAICFAFVLLVLYLFTIGIEHLYPTDLSSVPPRRRRGQPELEEELGQQAIKGTASDSRKTWLANSTAKFDQDYLAEDLQKIKDYLAKGHSDKSKSGSNSKSKLRVEIAESLTEISQRIPTRRTARKAKSCSVIMDPERPSCLRKTDSSPTVSNKGSVSGSGSSAHPGTSATTASPASMKSPNIRMRRTASNKMVAIAPKEGALKQQMNLQTNQNKRQSSSSQVSALSSYQENIMAKRVKNRYTAAAVPQISSNELPKRSNKSRSSKKRRSKKTRKNQKTNAKSNEKENPKPKFSRKKRRGKFVVGTLLPKRTDSDSSNIKDSPIVKVVPADTSPFASPPTVEETSSCSSVVKNYKAAIEQYGLSSTRPHVELAKMSQSPSPARRAKTITKALGKANEPIKTMPAKETSPNSAKQPQITSIGVTDLTQFNKPSTSSDLKPCKEKGQNGGPHSDSALQPRNFKACYPCFSNKFQKIDFKWKHGGEAVYLTGSFFNWDLRIPMQLGRMSHQTGLKKEFTATLCIAPGHHEFKFIVDLDWKIDPDLPTKANGLGGLNNVVHIADHTCNDELTESEISKS